MALDPNIALQVQPLRIPDPLESYERPMRLRSLLGQSRLQDLQRQQAERSIARQARRDELMQRSGGDLTTLRNLLAGEGYLDEALDIEGKLLGRDKAEREARTAQFKLLKEQADRTASLASSVLLADPASRPRAYAQARAQAIAEGLIQDNDPTYPAVYSPQVESILRRVSGQALSIKDALERADQDTASRWLAEQQAAGGPQISALPAGETPIGAGEVPYNEGSENVPMFDYLTELDIAQGRKTWRRTPEGQIEVMPAEQQTQPPPVELASEFQNPVTLRKKASNLERQAQQLLAMRGGEKKANELLQLAAQYRMDADRIEGRTQELEKRESELIEIADPSSPSGTRFIRKSEAEGKPGAKRFGASQVNVDVRRETKGAEKMGQLDAEHVAEARNSANAAGRLTSMLSRMEASTASGATFGGTFADWATSLGRFAASLDIPVDIKKIAGSEQYQADVAELVRAKIKALGAGNAISNVDLLFTQRSMPELSKTPQGRMLIIRAMKADAEMIQDYYRKARDYFDANGSLKGFEYEPPETSLIFMEKKTIGGKNYGKLLDGTWVQLK